jgi:uncharacterized protein
MRKFSLLIASLFLFCSVSTASAQRFPEPNGFVNDFAQLLSEEQARSLNDELIAFEQKTTIEIVVVTVSSLNGMEIKDYAKELANTWGVGKEKTNNGVIFLIAPNERGMYIEAAVGIRDILPRWRTDRIRDRDVLPRFRAKDLPGGIINGTHAIIATIVAVNAPPPPPRKWSATDTKILLYIIGGIATIVILLILIVPQIRQRRACAYVLKMRGTFLEQFAIVDLKGSNPDVTDNTRSNLTDLREKFRTIEQLRADSPEVDWCETRETLDRLLSQVRGTEWQMDRQIHYAKTARRDGPALMAKIPSLIEEAERKLAEGSTSVRATRHLEEARAQYAQARTQKSGMSIVDWVILYAILTNVESKIAHAESTHDTANNGWVDHSNSRSSDDTPVYGFGNSGGLGGGDGFTGGGSAGSW